MNIKTEENKARYTATQVACGWAGAVMKRLTPPSYWAGAVLQRPLVNAEKANSDRPTDRQT